MDSLIHRITECKERFIIWNQFIKIMNLITRQFFQHTPNKHIINFPAFQAFPKARTRTMFWINFQTTDIILHHKNVDTVERYVYALQCLLPV